MKTNEKYKVLAFPDNGDENKKQFPQTLGYLKKTPNGHLGGYLSVVVGMPSVYALFISEEFEGAAPDWAKHSQPMLVKVRVNIGGDETILKTVGRVFLSKNGTGNYTGSVNIVAGAVVRLVLLPEKEEVEQGPDKVEGNVEDVKKFTAAAKSSTIKKVSEEVPESDTSIFQQAESASALNEDELPF